MSTVTSWLCLGLISIKRPLNHSLIDREILLWGQEIEEATPYEQENITLESWNRTITRSELVKIAARLLATTVTANHKWLLQYSALQYLWEMLLVKFDSEKQTVVLYKTRNKA